MPPRATIKRNMPCINFKGKHIPHRLTHCKLTETNFDSNNHDVVAPNHSLKPRTPAAKLITSPKSGRCWRPGA